MAVYLVDFENVTSAGISGVQKLTKEDKVYIFYTANAANMSFAAHLNLLSSPAEIIYYNVSSGGKNALDFQLSSFLGYLISQGKDKQFYIISNDRGYEHVKTFWELSGMADGVTINGSPSVNRTLALEKPFAARIVQEAKQEEIPVAEEIAVPEIEETAVQEAVTEEISVEPEVKKPAPKKKTTKRKTAKAVKEAVPEAMDVLKATLAKAEVEDEEQTAKIYELLKKSSGKQQFYREILKIYGMERGVEVYKTLRPEYTNLTKLVRK
ncbi:MAG: hypothetical protein IJ305_01600 [Oscillospiraceae bacterium]|nr:hypothetical protein [Oscillospiraceae bacterium]